jgi:Holliday junction resolvase RusA-like endonuclease
MTINVIAFCVPGEPQGKGRPRATTINGMARLYTPKKTASYEGLVAHAAQQAMRGAVPFDRPCRIELDVLCTVPASWSAKKRAQALAGAIRPTKKPDADNVLKAVCDGMNGVVWRDDVQVVEWSGRKLYAETPGVNVRVACLEV